MLEMERSGTISSCSTELLHSTSFLGAGAEKSFHTGSNCLFSDNPCVLPDLIRAEFGLTVTRFTDLVRLILGS